MILTGGQALGEQASFSDTWAYGADDDGDLRVGGYDNCPGIANPNQSNLDGDLAGDACDCAPSDAGAWSPPQLVSDLRWTGAATLAWDDESSAVGPGVRYDLASGDLDQLRASGGFAGGVCVASQVGAASATDARVPGPAAGFWYLARARNVCGIGSYGPAALDGASPCP